MSNYNPKPNVKEKWPYSRKGEKKLGNSFTHPRIFSTVGIKTDSVLFWIAIVIEIICIFLSIIVSGINPIFILVATGLVIVDLIFAFFAHLNQKNLCLLRCKLAIANYENNKKINNEAKDILRICKSSIRTIETKVHFYDSVIVLSALIKIAGFYVLNPFGFGAFLVIAVLFSFAAYIHITRTPFFMGYANFKRTKDKDEGFYLGAVAKGEDDERITKKFIDHELKNINNTNSNEFKQKFTQLTELEKNERKITIENRRDLVSNIFILYGVNSEHKIVYDDNIKKTFFWIWGILEDKDLFEFINKNGLSSEEIKSYLGYVGLEIQLSEVDKENIITKNSKDNE